MLTMRSCWLPALLVSMLSTALVIGAGPVADDDANEKSAPATGDDGSDEGNGDALLAGPKVEDEPEASDNPGFGGEDRMRQSVEVPPGRWFSVLRDVELSDEQREQAAAIAREYEDSMRTFRRENAQALRELEARIRRSRETGEFDPKLREEYRAIQSNAPDAKPFQDRIWQLLGAEQQEVFKAKLEEARKRIAERRARERDDRLDTMRRGGGDDAMGPGAMDGQGDDAQPPMRAGDDGARDARLRGRGLDAMSQKRFEFLMSKRSKTAARDGALDGLRERRNANDRRRQRQRDRQPAEPQQPSEPAEPTD